MLKEYTEAELDSLMMNFTIMIDGKIHELIPDGANTMLKIDNLDLYLEKTIEFYTFKSIEKPYKAFLEGFNHHINVPLLLKYFHDDEIVELICGKKTIDREEIINACYFERVSTSSRYVKIFKDYIH